METNCGTDSENINVAKDKLQEYEKTRNSENTELDSVDIFADVENEQEEENDNDDEELDPKKTEDSSSKVVRLTRLPISRIKGIMKFDDELTAATQEAVFIITKATEIFIEELSKEMYQFTMANKKKTIQKRDVENAFWSQDYFTFLDGCFNE